MEALAKTCSVLAAFGAVNWAILGMFETDAVRALLGSGRTTGTDMLRIVVAFAALYTILVAFRRRPASS